MPTAPDLSSGRPLLARVFYGSETGNAFDVAVQVHDALRRLRFRSRLAEIDSVSGVEELYDADIVVFVLSTTGQGHLPANSLRFWRAIRSSRLPADVLGPVSFTSFGLGDSNYPKFNWAHRKLRNRLLQLSAQSIYPPAESDEQHPDGIDGALVPWLAGLTDHLKATHSLENTLPPTHSLEPEWYLDTAATAPATPQHPPAPPTEKTHSATVVFNDRITPDTHWQDVRHIGLTAPDTIGYRPGDIISVQPENHPSDVDLFLSLTGLLHLADAPVRFVQSDPSVPLEHVSPPPCPLPDQATTLRHYLTVYADITAVPRRSFFSHLLALSTDEVHKERLAEFCDPAEIDSLFDYTTRPRRSILEILQEFDSVKIPLGLFASVIPLLRPRLFSIASGGPLKHPTPGTTNFELLVAIVKYRTVIKRLRHGVCTRHMSSWAPGDAVSFSVRKGLFITDPAQVPTPSIMVGPGTGVAPLRSLIWEKYGALLKGEPGDRKEKREHSLPKDILFFGCRNKDADFYFKDEWAAISDASGGSFRYFGAFSRDQREKTYVQDLVRQQREIVEPLLNSDPRSTLYICGSSGKMPEAVRNAIADTLLPLTADPNSDGHNADRKAVLATLERAGRIKEDTW